MLLLNSLPPYFPLLPSFLTFLGILFAITMLDPNTTSGEGDKLHPFSELKVFAGGPMMKPTESQWGYSVLTFPLCLIPGSHPHSNQWDSGVCPSGHSHHHWAAHGHKEHRGSELPVSCLFIAELDSAMTPPPCRAQGLSRTQSISCPQGFPAREHGVGGEGSELLP